MDPYSLFFIEVILVQFAELRRWQDFRNPGSQGNQYFLGLEEVLKGSGEPSYPGQCALPVFHARTFLCSSSICSAEEFAVTSSLDW